MTRPPVEMSVATSRLRLSVRERVGGGPPIVLLHGLASNARWWDLVGERLAPANRVVAPDQRGHGRSEAPGTGYDLEGAVADLDALIDALGLPPAVVCGHSWGAWVALAYAGRHPESVISTVCVDGGFFRLRDHFGDTWVLAATAMAPAELHGLTERRLREWIRESPLAEGSDAATAAAIVGGNLRLDPGTQDLQPVLTFDRHMSIARSLYEVDVTALLLAQERPVLIVPAVGGDLDDRRRAAVHEALTHLRQLGSVAWIDGGHDLPVQRPQQVADAIRSVIPAQHCP